MPRYKKEQKKEFQAGLLGVIAFFLLIGMVIIFIPLIPALITQFAIHFETTIETISVILLILFSFAFLCVSYLSYECYQNE